MTLNPVARQQFAVDLAIRIARQGPSHGLNAGRHHIGRHALPAIGQKAVIELVGILGYYTLISMTIVAFDVPVPAGTTDPFADRPKLG